MSGAGEETRATASDRASTRDGHPPTTPWAVDLSCGIAAGMAYTVVAHPFDTVKVAMQSRASHLPARGTADTVRHIVRGRRGALGLFKGLSAPLVGYSLECGINYASFSQCRQWLERHGPFADPAFFFVRGPERRRRRLRVGDDEAFPAAARAAWRSPSRRVGWVFAQRRRGTDGPHQVPRSGRAVLRPAGGHLQNLRERWTRGVRARSGRHHAPRDPGERAVLRRLRNRASRVSALRSSRAPFFPSRTERARTDRRGHDRDLLLLVVRVLGAGDRGGHLVQASRGRRFGSPCSRWTTPSAPASRGKAAPDDVGAWRLIARTAPERGWRGLYAGRVADVAPRFPGERRAVPGVGAGVPSCRGAPGRARVREDNRERQSCAGRAQTDLLGLVT